MSMIICKECGKEFSDKANACPNCGCPIWDAYTPPIRNTPQNVSLVNRQESKPKEENNNNKKKNSTLSAWAAICALFTCTSFIGFILGLIDLSKKDDTQKHTGSWFAIIFFVIMCILAFATSGEEEDDTEINNNKVVVENVNEENNVIQNEKMKNTEEPVTTEEPIETEEEYKASCQEYNYKDVLRNPDDYIGKRIFITIEISSVFSEDWSTPIKYYFGNSKSSEDSEYYYGDRYAVFDYRYDNSLKLLQDDVITVWGEISKPQETTSLIVNSEELFCIDMKYVELIAE